LANLKNKLRKNKQKSSKSLDQDKDDSFEEYTVPQSESLLSQKLDETEFKDRILPKSTEVKMKVQDEFIKAKVKRVDSLLSGLKNKYN